MKKFVAFLLVLVIATTGGVYEIAGRENDAPAVVYIENDYLRLDFFTETAKLVVTCLHTGNVWRCSHEDRVSELFSFRYVYAGDARIGGRYSAYMHSIRYGRFEYEIIDEMLELRFTVGEMPVEVEVDHSNFYVPPMIAMDRLNDLVFAVEGLSRAERRRVLSSFSRDRDADDHTTMFLNENLSEHELLFIEEILRRGGYTPEEWAADMEAFLALPVPVFPTFNIVMQFALDGDAMVVTVPIDRITHTDDHLIMDLSIMRGFGNYRYGDGGYLFMPYGTHIEHMFMGQGSLIFNNRIENRVSIIPQHFNYPLNDPAYLIEWLKNEHNFWRDLYILEEGNWINATLEIWERDFRLARPAFGIKEAFGRSFAAYIEGGAENLTIYSSHSVVTPTFTLHEWIHIATCRHCAYDIYEGRDTFSAGDSIVIRYVFNAIPTQDVAAICFWDFFLP